MPRRRYIFTENGKPLAKPIEVILDDPPAKALPAAEQLPAHLPLPQGIRPGTSESQAADWGSFKIPGEE